MHKIIAIAGARLLAGRTLGKPNPALTGWRHMARRNLELARRFSARRRLGRGRINTARRNTANQSKTRKNRDRCTINKTRT